MIRSATRFLSGNETGTALWPRLAGTPPLGMRKGQGFGRGWLEDLLCRMSFAKYGALKCVQPGASLVMSSWLVCTKHFGLTQKAREKKKKKLGAPTSENLFLYKPASLRPLIHSAESR